MEEENRRGLTVKGLLIRLILVIAFIFLLIWLFPMPDLKPLNNQIFSDNLDRMKNVAKTYYTTERLPKNINEYKKMSLKTMVDEHMIMKLMDSNGKYCSEDKSYVQITKLENEYVIKIYLSCTDKTDYIIEHFGCYDICSDTCKMLETTTTGKSSTNKVTTTKKKVTTTKKGYIYEYQFSKQTCSENFEKYVCPTGYSLVGNKCIKTGSATVTEAAKENITNVTSTETKNATKVTSTIGAIKTTNTQKVTANKVYSYDVKGAVAVKKTTTANYTAIQNYDVITATKIAISSGWKYDYTTISTASNLAYTNDTEKLVFIESWEEPTCSTCFTTVKKYRYYHYVKDYNYEYNCDNFAGYSLYNDKYCRKATTTTKGCPAGYTDTGSNCKKSEIVSYNCNRYGSDYVLDTNAKTCTKTTMSYTCPAGTTATSDASVCAKSNVSYSCPAGTTATSDSTICNKVTYTCPTSYTLVGTKCVKPVTTQKKTYSCDSGYTLNGTTCIKTVNTSDTKNAEAKYSTSCSTNYKWSTQSYIKGWTFTGNKRLVK